MTLPVPPSLTIEQRMEALKRSLEARRYRAEIKRKYCYGEISLEEVLQLGKTDPVIGKTRLSEILKCLPGVGNRKVELILAELGIKNRRLKGLGKLQTQKILNISL